MYLELVSKDLFEFEILSQGFIEPIKVSKLEENKTCMSKEHYIGC